MSPLVIPRSSRSPRPGYASSLRSAVCEPTALTGPRLRRAPQPRPVSCSRSTPSSLVVLARSPIAGYLTSSPALGRLFVAADLDAPSLHPAYLHQTLVEWRSHLRASAACPSFVRRLVSSTRRARRAIPFIIVRVFERRLGTGCPWRLRNAGRGGGSTHAGTIFFLHRDVSASRSWGHDLGPLAA